MRQKIRRLSEEERLARFFAELERTISEPPPGWLRDALPPGSTTKTRGHRGHLLP
jgi:hypothetical protein